MRLQTRRGFGREALGSLLTFSLLDTLFAADAWADEIKPVTAHWLAEVNSLAADVKSQQLKQIEWHTKIEDLFSRVDLPDLLRLIDFEKLTKNLELLDRGARSVRFEFPKVDGLPTELVFGKQIFAMKKGRSVVPHGHNNMATAFLILRGECHGRHYDRLEDHEDHFIIKPTIDRKFAAAEYSTVSDYKDNIHWFEAQSEPAFIFNIHVLDIRPGSDLPTGRVYLDPDGERLAGGLIKAPRVGYKEINKRYA